MPSHFNPALSVAIMVGYMIVVLGIGLWGWKSGSTKDAEGYLLADRGMHWFAGFFSFAASMISALAFMGLVAFYYQFGLSAFIAITGLGLIITTSGTYLFFGPKVWKIGRKFGHITPSDTLREYYDSPLYGYIVAIGLIVAMVPYLEIQFKGVGIVFKIGTGGMVSVAAGSAIIAIVIAIYTWLGGMKSVAWVDTMQGVMLLFGTFVGGIGILFIAADGFAPAYEAIMTDNPAMLSVPGAAGVFDWVYIVSFSLPVFAGWIFGPHIWMRLHYFEDGRMLFHLPWVWGLIIWLTQIGGWAVVLAGILVAPNVPPDQFVLTMHRQYFPTVVFGFIAAAALAAMMSSASSIVHGIGSVVARDITRNLKPEWEHKQVIIARVTIMVTIFAAFLLSLLDISLLLESGAAAASLATALVLPQVVAALYGWEWPTKQGAISASVLGPIVFLMLMFVPQLQSPLGLYEGAWGIIVNIIVFVGVSLITNVHPDKSTIRSWQRAITEPISTLDQEFRAEDPENLETDDD